MKTDIIFYRRNINYRNGDFMAFIEDFYYGNIETQNYNEMYCEIEKEAFVYAFRLVGNVIFEAFSNDI